MIQNNGSFSRKHRIKQKADNFQTYSQKVTTRHNKGNDQTDNVKGIHEIQTYQLEETMKLPAVKVLGICGSQDVGTDERSRRFRVDLARVQL